MKGSWTVGRSPSRRTLRLASLVVMIALLMLLSGLSFVNARSLSGDGVPLAASTGLSGFGAAPPYNLTFSETGLPSGTLWSVMVDGSALSSNTSSIVFQEGNGTFNFSVSNVPTGFGLIYAPSPGFGSTGLNGGDGGVSISFSSASAYPVSFVEKGLPAGTPWSISGNAVVYSNTSVPVGASGLSKGTINVSEPLGWFVFQLGFPSGYGVARITGPGTPDQTEVNISAAGAVWHIIFGPLEPVYFNETNVSDLQLYPGGVWGVSLLPTLPHGGPSPLQGVTNGTSIMFLVPTGASFKFSVVAYGIYGSDYRISPSHGALQVPHHPWAKVVKFHLLTARVVFLESGLPAGTNYTITVVGPGPFPQPGFSPSATGTHQGPTSFARGTIKTTGTGTSGGGTTSVSVALPAGTYDWWMNSTGYTAAPANGSFSILGPSLATKVKAVFSPNSTAGGPLGAAFGVGVVSNVTGGSPTPPGCLSGIECYSVDIAAAGNGLTPAGISLAARDALGGAVSETGWTFTLVSLTGVAQDATWSGSGSCMGAACSAPLSAGETIVLSTGGTSSLEGDALVAVGMSPFSGTVVSGALPS